jgi:hypothetical protein
LVQNLGIAATNYTEFGANTLHKWSGIEDGRHLDEELIHLVKKGFSCPPCPVIRKLWPIIANLKADF